ncbi:hypothetical protein Taro_015135 [Colocasia esculenta]|uniref:Secreted protein n=1 Tax=Colocasia esculenta TaxID=4460 RepID=A0A843UGQ6_COLES|nr:hypothetical protein [Colocasia esculenta]
MVAVFARAAVGFVLGLRVCVGVSRKLREPACGVAFTSAELWSAEPWPLGLSGLQTSGAISVGVCHASSLSPGARHLRACPRDRLLPLPGTPSPARLLEGVLRAAGVLKSLTWSRKGKRWGKRHRVICRALLAGSGRRGGLVLFRCGPASHSYCLALCWLRSHVGRSGVGPQLGRAAVVVLFFAVPSGCRVLTPDCCFGNPFLGAVRGGTGRCSSLTSWSVRGAGWFCLWALDLVETLVSRSRSGVSMSFFVSAGVCRGLLLHVFDSAGSTGVVFGLTRVVVEAVVLLPLVGVPAALAGKGLVIPTEPCSRNKQKAKKPKAMVATWSDSDQSSSEAKEPKKEECGLMAIED